MNDILVHDPGTWENKDGPLDWYAISNEDGIFAYANTEQNTYDIRDAFRALNVASKL